MNTSLFSNMFKSLFGEQITPTAQQFVPITASDGTPAGISSMVNLAPLLGVETKAIDNGVCFGLSFPINDGFGIKLSIIGGIAGIESYALFALGSGGRMYYKYVWMGSTSMEWKLVSAT